VRIHKARTPSLINRHLLVSSRKGYTSWSLTSELEIKLTPRTYPMTLQSLTFHYSIITHAASISQLHQITASRSTGSTSYFQSQLISFYGLGLLEIIVLGLRAPGA
jgi:hypothetical protein